MKKWKYIIKNEKYGQESIPFRDYVTVYNSGAFWSRSKSKTGRSYSLQEKKSCLELF